jgi:predicted nucleotidyltransferase
MTLSIPDRIKAEEARRRTEAAGLIRDALAFYGRALGGRYWLYGSAARGAITHRSDIDLLIDFPPDKRREAYNYAERVCAEFAMEAHLMPLDWCADDFLDHIRPDMVSLP